MNTWHPIFFHFINSFIKTQNFSLYKLILFFFLLRLRLYYLIRTELFYVLPFSELFDFLPFLHTWVHRIM